jgi:hypothetical protein
MASLTLNSTNRAGILCKVRSAFKPSDLNVLLTEGRYQHFSNTMYGIEIEVFSARLCIFYRSDEVAICWQRRQHIDSRSVYYSRSSSLAIYLIKRNRVRRLSW